MKGFIRSKLILSLVAFVMILAAIVTPLSGNITHSFADSGFRIVFNGHTGPLQSVTSISADNVWAVGYQYTGSGAFSLIGHWNGTSWSTQTGPTPGGPRGNYLLGVKALSATSIWAVGS